MTTTEPRGRTSVSDVATLLAVAALWGASFLFIRVAVPNLRPVPLIAARVLLAGVALLVAVTVLRRPPAWRRDGAAYLLLGGVSAAAPFTLIAAAELRLTASLAAVLNATTPLFALGLTQSAVSHTVASLEKELTVPLILRRRGGTMVTSHGQQVLRHAREAVHRVDRIAQYCAVVAGRHRGRLRIAAFPSAAQLLPPLIAELARCQPEVTVVLLEGTDAEVRDWLRDRVIDLGLVGELRTGDRPSSPAPGALLAQDQMVAVLDGGHPLAGQPVVALDDLVDDAFLLSDGGCEPLLHQMHQAAGLRLQPARRVRDMATLLALVAEQLGVTVVPELALPAGHQLAVVPVTPTAHRALYLVPADERDLPAAGHVLLDITRDRSRR